MIRRSIVGVALCLVPRATLACPVCFGQNDGPLAAGTNMGIFVMLGFVAAMMTTFGSFFVYLMRRARAVEPTMRSGEPTAPAAAAQEGTA